MVVGAVRGGCPQANSKTFSFRVADCEGYVTVGEYEDGGPGEVFIKVSKQGSTLAGIMDAFSIAISLGLQHQVPLATFVTKYANMKFEPAESQTIPSSHRIEPGRLHLPASGARLPHAGGTRRLGILSTQERSQPTLPGVEEMATPSVGLVDNRIGIGTGERGNRLWVQPDRCPVRYRGSQSDGRLRSARGTGRTADAPYCYNCGNVMQRAGSCYVCGSCGSTSGCS